MHVSKWSRSAKYGDKNYFVHRLDFDENFHQKKYYFFFMASVSHHQNYYYFFSKLFLSQFHFWKIILAEYMIGKNGWRFRWIILKYWAWVATSESALECLKVLVNHDADLTIPNYFGEKKIIILVVADTMKKK